MSVLGDRLLAETKARRVYLVDGQGIDSAGAVHADRWSTQGYLSTPQETPPNTRFRKRVTTAFNRSSSLDSGDGRYVGISSSVDVLVVEVENLDGRYDAWRSYSIDGQPFTIRVVGELEDGTKVGLADAPTIFSGVGLNQPFAGDNILRFSLRSQSHFLTKEAQTETFSPPCPAFPGSATEFISLGTTALGFTSTFSIEGWIELRSNTGTQIICQRTDGVSGLSLEVGTPGAGAVRFTVRGLSVVNLDTATGLVPTDRAVYVYATYSAVSQRKRIFIDGSQVAEVTGLTGAPTVAAGASAVIGKSLLGTISRMATWIQDKTSAEQLANWKSPLSGSEANLVNYLPMDEGKGATIKDRKAGSVLTGTLTNGVGWTGTATWCGESLINVRRKRVLGSAFRVEAVARDMPRGLYELALGPLMRVPALYSNGNAFAGGSFTTDLTRGLVNISGAHAGTRITADVVPWSPWGWGTSHDGIGGRVTVGDVCDLSGAFSLVISFRPRVLGGFGRFMNKDDGANGWFFGQGTSGAGDLFLGIRPNIHVAANAYSRLNIWYRAVVIYNPADSNRLRILVDGAQKLNVTGVAAPVANAIALGFGARAADGASPFAGDLDEPLIFNRALTDAEALRLTVAPATGLESGLIGGWRFNEGTGTAAASILGGGPAGTLTTGCTWTPGRASAADLILAELQRAGITSYDPTSFASVQRVVPGEQQYVIDDSRSFRTVIQDLAVGSGLILRERNSVWELSPFELPTGPAGTPHYTVQRAQPGGIIPLELPPPVYRVEVAYARNHTKLSANEVAAILSTDDRNFSIEEYRYAPAQDLKILEHFPNARVMEIESCFADRTNAGLEAERWLSLLRPAARGYQVALDATGSTTEPGSQILLSVYDRSPATGNLVPRLGLQGTPFLVVQAAGEDPEAVLVTVWRKETW